MCAQKSEQVDAVVARAQDYTPCLSFSRARDCRPGPPPLRSNSQPLGLPDLSEVDQPKVEVGNRPMRFTVRFMTACIFLRVSCCFENPATSRIWLCPPVRRLLRRRHVCSQRVDYCMFGTLWKKPTLFVGAHLSLDSLQPYVCQGSRRGLCSHSQRVHLPLAGQNSQGQGLTKVSKPYPRLLCQLLIGPLFLQYLSPATWFRVWSACDAREHAVMGVFSAGMGGF